MNRLFGSASTDAQLKVASCPNSSTECGRGCDANMVSTLPTAYSELQRADFQRQAFGRQTRIAAKWQDNVTINGTENWTVRPPWAQASEMDPRSLPSQASRSITDQRAGMPTFHEAGRATLPRCGAAGSENLQTAGASTLLCSDRMPAMPPQGDERELTGVELAFKSPRCRPLTGETSQMTKLRGLRSAPRCFGFVHPDARFGATTKVLDVCHETLPQGEESYPLSHAVKRAQCRPSGTFHVY